MYYIYVLASINLNSSNLSPVIGFMVRFMPTINVFLFYFLLPFIYSTLREKMLMQSAQTALKQKLISTEDQITLLNKTNSQWLSIGMMCAISSSCWTVC